MKRVLPIASMKPGWLLISVVILMLALASCGSPGGTGGAVDATAAPGAAGEPTDDLGLGDVETEPGTDDITGTAAITDTVPEDAGATPSETEVAPMDEETPAAAGEATGATVMVSSHDEFGEILTDGAGMTLYLFTKDTPNTSNCYEQCATNWPPLFAEGDPVAGDGVNADLLGVTERTDGTSQVTYNGWPLYYYAEDKDPGDVTGQGVGDVWYVVSPEGEKIEGAAE